MKTLYGLVGKIEIRSENIIFCLRFSTTNKKVLSCGWREHGLFQKLTICSRTISTWSSILAIPGPTNHDNETQPSPLQKILRPLRTEICHHNLKRMIANDNTHAARDIFNTVGSVMLLRRRSLYRWKRSNQLNSCYLILTTLVSNKTISHQQNFIWCYRCFAHANRKYHSWYLCWESLQKNYAYALKFITIWRECKWQHICSTRYF